MRRRSAVARSGQGERPGGRVTRGRGAGWALLLGVLVVVLAAATAIVEQYDSLRWLLWLVVAADALAGVGVVLLTSSWWQQRRDDRARQAEVGARRARQRARDQRDHFEPRGRGVLPRGGRRGWYFTGRRRALRELADWLAAPAGSKPAVQVVTGAPGSGKSAVLGRLVLLADKTHRQTAVRADPNLDPATLPPEGSIALSVHARGQTSRQVVESIAAVVGLDESVSLEDLLDMLEDRAPALTVVVDALDEATEPEELAGVVAQLAGTGGVRLLVGTRRHLVNRLADPSLALDLDEQTYLEPGDVAEYVRRSLLLQGDPGIPTPYRGNAELAATVASAVAARAGRSFLVAQLVGLSLVKDEQVVDVALPGWRERFPRQLEDAMREYLDRFGADRSRVRDLLVPLAFAEGDGLADEILWARLARELGTGKYKPQDVGWLRQDTSVPNLLQPTVLGDGTVAWRLFHEALAKYLRDHEVRFGAQEVQRRIIRVLVDRVPTRHGRKEWVAADAYTRSHLAAHAAAAGRLDEFVADPGLLLAAEPARLLRVLPMVTSPTAWAAARAYQQAAHQLTSDRPLGQRVSCLQRAARYCDAHDLAEQIEGLGILLPWTTRWAYWQVSGMSRKLTGHEQDVSAVAFGLVDGQPVIVSGSEDGSVRVWDARSGQPRGEPLWPLTGHGGLWGVRTVALGEIDGEPVIVSGSGDNTVRVWDARSGQPRGEWVTGHTGSVSVVTFGEVDGQPVVFSHSMDGSVGIWDARSGQPRGEWVTGHKQELGLGAVVFGEVDGQPVIVCGRSDGSVWMRDLRSGQPLGKPLAVLAIWASAIALGRVDGQPVIVFGGQDDSVWVWDARSCQPRGERVRDHIRGVSAIALGEVDGQPVIVSGGGDNTVRVWDARSGLPRGEPLRGHTGSVSAVAFGEVDGQPVIISGSTDASMRIWDARSSQPRRGPLPGHPWAVSAVAQGEIEGRPVIVSSSGNRFLGDDNTVRVWDARSGQPRGEWVTGHTGSVSAVAFGEVDGQPVIISGGGGDSLQVWDARSGQRRGEPLRGHTGEVSAVAFGDIDGQPVIISSDSNGSVRMWDTRSGQLWGERRTGTFTFMRQAAPQGVRAVALGKINGQPVIVLVISRAIQGWVWVWDARSGQPRGEPFAGPWVQAVALGEIDDHPVIVSGDSQGIVQVWDARLGIRWGEPLTGHTGAVSAVTLEEVNGRQVIVSGDSNGSVRVSDTRSGEHRRIEADAPVSGLVCTTEGLIVAATRLGLAAFQLSAAGATLHPSSPNEVRL